MKHRMDLPILIFIVYTLQIFQKVSPERRPTFAGPFRAVIRRITNESDEYSSSGKVWSEIQVTPPIPGQTQYRWGHTHVGLNLSDDIKAEVRMALWSNNEWKKNAVVMKLDHACSKLSVNGKSLAQFVFGSEEFKCPLMSGPRTLKNESFDITFPDLRVFPYGRYYFTLVGSTEREILAIYNGLVDIVPRF